MNKKVLDLLLLYSQNIAGIVAIIPLTSVKNALKYEGSLEIFKSDLNGLDVDSIALTYQIKIIDIRFLESKIGELDKNNLELIDNKIRGFLEL